jgi:hypothetical protein
MIGNRGSGHQECALPKTSHVLFYIPGLTPNRFLNYNHGWISLSAQLAGNLDLAHHLLDDVRFFILNESSLDCASQATLSLIE